MKKLFIFAILFFITISAVAYDDTTWYKSQIGTGMGNCGPACAAMLIQRSGVDITVEAARKLIGYKSENGATNMFEIMYILQQYYIDYKLLKNLDQYYGHGVVLILVNTTYIKNRGYSYAGGHYIIITGILNNKYYLVHDPISGPNKAYKISDVKAALRFKPIWVQ